MIPCTGCRFLVHARNIDVCRATDDDGRHAVMNPWSGRLETVYRFRPTLADMRRDDGPCGFARALYQPSLREMLSRWWRTP